MKTIDVPWPYICIYVGCRPSRTTRKLLPVQFFRSCSVLYDIYVLPSSGQSRSQPDFSIIHFYQSRVTSSPRDVHTYGHEARLNQASRKRVVKTFFHHPPLTYPSWRKQGFSTGLTTQWHTLVDTSKQMCRLPLFIIKHDQTSPWSVATAMNPSTSFYNNE